MHKINKNPKLFGNVFKNTVSNTGLYVTCSNEFISSCCLEGRRYLEDKTKSNVYNRK